VNIVLVGYEDGTGPRDINLPVFRAGLSNTHRPRVRIPASAYGVIEDLGLSFRYQYNVVFANSAFESAFFSYLNGLPFGDLYSCYSDHLNQYLEGDPDYEEPIFILHGTETKTPLSFGFADDNWRDGKQSYVFIHLSPFRRQFLGYSGYTTHEVGHHLGLSHPHDGYDSESGRRIGPRNQFYFAWTGDGSNSAMSYQQAEIKDYSQFDQDNMHRWLTSTYVNEANRILGWIVVSPRASEVASDLTSADTSAASALASYAAFNYLNAATDARNAYDKILSAARKINIPVEPQASQSDYKAQGASEKFSSVFDDIEDNYPRRGARR